MLPLTVSPIAGPLGSLWITEASFAKGKKILYSLYWELHEGFTAPLGKTQIIMNMNSMNSQERSTIYSLQQKFSPRHYPTFEDLHFTCQKRFVDFFVKDPFLRGPVLYHISAKLTFLNLNQRNMAPLNTSFPDLWGYTSSGWLDWISWIIFVITYISRTVISEPIQLTSTLYDPTCLQVWLRKGMATIKMESFTLSSSTQGTYCPSIATLFPLPWDSVSIPHNLIL